MNVGSNKFYICSSVSGVCETVAESSHCSSPTVHDSTPYDNKPKNALEYNIECEFDGNEFGFGYKYFASATGCANDNECGFGSRCVNSRCVSLRDSVCLYKTIPFVSDTEITLAGGDKINTNELVSRISDSWVGEPYAIIVGNSYVRKKTGEDVKTDLYDSDECPEPYTSSCEAVDCKGYCYTNENICNAQADCKWDAVAGHCVVDICEPGNCGKCGLKSSCLAQTDECFWTTTDWDTDAGGCCGLDDYGEPKKYDGVSLSCQEGGGAICVADEDDKYKPSACPSDILDPKGPCLGVDTTDKETCYDIGSAVYGFIEPYVIYPVP